jgi:uncharacterized protein YyaL (SSP411 family)
MSNALVHAMSPYLQQHAGNPVDWNPWEPEVLQRAKREEKPIFLSIGYSACHWCHVMEHESFEDPGIAGLLNDNFVSIKVDREEHPELDQIYMEAVQMITGQGGWPLSVFLTPELEPFYGGTYWPPKPRGGMPGFDQVLRAVADAWKTRRLDAVRQGQQLAELLRDTRLDDGSVPHPALSRELLRGAEASLDRLFDPQHGGFGDAPKFPHPLDIRLLLRAYRRTGSQPLLALATITLDKMAAGGIYDHLGGGFHRYSTDAQWLVPHFEKMLYDNALLAVAYLEAWQLTGNADYAHSEGHEGKFYLWRPDEILAVLGPDAGRAFCYVYDVTEPGNFEGRNILNRPKTLAQCATILGREPRELAADLDDARARLLAVRDRRVRPGCDDKVLTSWNGLMIDALARAGAALAEPRYVAAARRAAKFLLAQLRDADGRLLHVWREGQSRHEALLDDYAGLANALVSLYEADFDETWIDAAVGLADQIVQRFHDPEEGGFFYTSADRPSLIARKKDLLDSSVPSGGGLATMALLRLARLSGREEFATAAEDSLRASSALMARAPVGTGQMLLALDFHLGVTPELVVLGSDDAAATADVLAELQRVFLPSRVLAFRHALPASARRSDHLASIFAGKRPVSPGPTLFVCQQFACREPVSGPEAAARAIASLKVE